MRLCEVLGAVLVLSLFSAVFVQFSKPLVRLKAENDRKERAVNRDLFIHKSFLKICGGKKNVCDSDFSKFLLLCEKELFVSSIRVRKIGVKDKNALWKIEWDGKELYAVSKES